MGESFEVIYGGRAVGTVEMKKEGLYYRLSCRCRMFDNEIHRLYADGDKIGVLVPEGEQLVLETRVAARRLRSGCVFSLEENRAGFVPIRPGEAFPDLDKVRSGKLFFRQGEPGLILP